MSLETDIAAWDHKSSKDIGRIYQRFSGQAAFGSKLVALLGEPRLERGATWLLKHHLETGWPATSVTDITALCNALDRLEHWEARLHILQSLSYLPIPKSHVAFLERFLESAISDDVKFVRAWGYHGWHQLAVQHPQYQPQVSQMLSNAYASETAASVKVRIRKAMDAGF